ncbi:MAG: hypothetical protein EP349_10795 [Alphaproteobacteria bacterium]|nr:MAG: hypothetical protein EP349_10795 [Alphaproteobacteria bacterium]
MTKNAAAMIKAFHENVDDVLAAQDPARRKKDKARLREIRRLMAKSPLGKELLKWADANNIRIEMDHQTKAGGYYYQGYKIVALNAASDNLTLVGTLAHEIRHAWQDSHGMIPSLSGNLAQMQTPEDYITQIKFIEADAFAVGESVKRTVSAKRGQEMREEWALQFPEKDIDPLIFAMPLKDEETPELLAQRFTQFFHDAWRRNFYEDRCLKVYAKNIGVPDIKIPCGTGEYFNDKTKIAIHQDGLDLDDLQKIHLLGDMLGKGNYMDHLPEGISKMPVYRSLQAIRKIRQYAQRPQKRLEKDFAAALRSVKMPPRRKPTLRTDNNLLYYYVKYLHKQHRMG